MKSRPLEELSPIQQRIHAAALKLFAERGATQVSVSDLAQAAGVARGTIYNNLPDPEQLFESVAAQLADEMNRRITESFHGASDPAQRLSNGIRQYIKRGHEDPNWARFICRFAYSEASVQQVWQTHLLKDLNLGLQMGRYQLRPEQMPTAIALIAGLALGGIRLVLEGSKTWRDAGSEAAELTLIALGMPRDQAVELACCELPLLSPSRLFDLAA